MISELYIENFIIIKKLNIEFSKKLNVITGETGSGKSILVNALQLLLGARFQKNFFGNYGKYSIIEGKFIILDKSKLLEFENNGYPLEDNELIITRKLDFDGKTTNKINGRNISLSMLKELMLDVMDVHGQNENQKLLKKDNYLNLLDLFNPSYIDIKKKDLRNLIQEKEKISNEIQNLSLSSIEIDREKDLLNYQLSELNELDLDNIKEKEIVDEYNILSNVEDITKSLTLVKNLYNSNDYNNIDIFSFIEQSLSILSNYLDKDKNLSSFHDSINDIYYNLQDIIYNIDKYNSNLFVDDEQLAILNNQLEILTRLKRKYGQNIEELLVFKKKIISRLERLDNIEENLALLYLSIEKIEIKIKEIADSISVERKSIAKKLEKDIKKNIKDLNMPNVRFIISFSKLDKISIAGYDKIDFLISSNIGQEMDYMDKVASGGELSRIMLGFKAALAEVDNIETLVFDEIDIGISGRTAQAVGSKLIDYSKNRQLIVISHLPQIAALAEHHLLIDKEELNENTISNIYAIKENDRVLEIARLIGGVNITETTIKQAEEMIQQGNSLLLSKRSKE